jgi:hypothetical protein
LISTYADASPEFDCSSKRRQPPQSRRVVSIHHRFIRFSAFSWNHFGGIPFLNSSNGSVREDQFIPFARATIFNNRVEQRLMDIQFAGNSSGRFEIISGDVVGFADDINRL